MTTKFPIHKNKLAMSMEANTNEAVKIDGMTVLFDETAALISTELVTTKSRVGYRVPKSNNRSAYGMSMPEPEYLEIIVSQEGLTIHDMLNAHWSGLSVSEQEKLTQEVLAKNSGINGAYEVIPLGTALQFPYPAVEVRASETSAIQTSEYEAFASDFISQVYDAQSRALSSFKEIFTLPEFATKTNNNVSAILGLADLAKEIVLLYVPPQVETAVKVMEWAVNAMTSAVSQIEEGDPARSIFAYIQQQENILSQMVQKRSLMIQQMKDAYLAELSSLTSEEAKLVFRKGVYQFVKGYLPKNPPIATVSKVYLQRLIEDYMTKVEPNAKLKVRLIYKPNRENSITYLDRAYIDGTPFNEKLAEKINSCFLDRTIMKNGVDTKPYKDIPLQAFKVKKRFYYDFANTTKILELEADNTVKGEDDALNGMQYLRGNAKGNLYNTTIYQLMDEPDPWTGQYYAIKTRIVHPKRLL